MDMFAPILINIFNSITDTIVSINIPFYLIKYFAEVPLSTDMHEQYSSSKLFCIMYPHRTKFNCLSILVETKMERTTHVHRLIVSKHNQKYQIRICFVFRQGNVCFKWKVHVNILHRVNYLKAKSIKTNWRRMVYTFYTSILALSIWSKPVKYCYIVRGIFILKMMRETNLLRVNILNLK